jgi:hypothetical protein
MPYIGLNSLGEKWPKSEGRGFNPAVSGAISAFFSWASAPEALVGAVFTQALKPLC